MYFDRKWTNGHMCVIVCVYVLPQSEYFHKFMNIMKIYFDV